MVECPPGLIASLFCGLGLGGVIATLFAVFFIDSMLVPAVPEFFALFFFAGEGAEFYLAQYGAATWGGIILVTVVVAELLANSMLYLLVKRKRHRVPGFVERAMHYWRGILILKDERAVLLNRIVPIMPFMGAFIAISPWNARKAIAYVGIGGFLKYSALLLFVGYLHVTDVATARRATYVLIAVLVVWGLVSSYALKKRREARGEPSKAPPQG
ncbi:MAG TPA: hypothetical protein VM681_10460 [Candidatus Thermoplasmatota archaeon]|nr:hypothetical protein [Candidatus Thermoplasmatota archaeon]